MKTVAVVADTAVAAAVVVVAAVVVAAATAAAAAMAAAAADVIDRRLAPGGGCLGLPFAKTPRSLERGTCTSALRAPPSLKLATH